MCLFITDLSSLVELATSNKEFCKIIEVPSLDNLHTNAFANQGFSESLMKNNLFKSSTFSESLVLHNNRCSLTHSQTAFANLCFRSLHSKIENRFGFKNKDGFLELVIIVPFTMIHFGFQKSNDQYIGARVIEVIIFYEI